jgi:hypothetical protein
MNALASYIGQARRPDEFERRSRGSTRGRVSVSPVCTYLKPSGSGIKFLLLPLFLVLQLRLETMDTGMEVEDMPSWFMDLLFRGTGAHSERDVQIRADLQTLINHRQSNQGSSDRLSPQ